MCGPGKESYTPAVKLPMDLDKQLPTSNVKPFYLSRLSLDVRKWAGIQRRIQDFSKRDADVVTSLLFFTPLHAAYQLHFPCHKVASSNLLKGVKGDTSL